MQAMIKDITKINLNIIDLNYDNLSIVVKFNTVYNNILIESQPLSYDLQQFIRDYNADANPFISILNEYDYIISKLALLGQSILFNMIEKENLKKEKIIELIQNNLNKEIEVDINNLNFFNV